MPETHQQICPYCLAELVPSNSVVQCNQCHIAFDAGGNQVSIKQVIPNVHSHFGLLPNTGKVHENTGYNGGFDHFSPDSNSPLKQTEQATEADSGKEWPDNPTEMAMF